MNGKGNLQDYRRRLRPQVAGSIALFAGGILLGVIANFYAPHSAEYLNRNIAGFIEIFHGLSKLELAAAIFLNNTIKALLVIVGGTAFGVIPIIFLLGNGAALGFLFSASIHSRGLMTMLLAVLPHGIFEVPAILLASSIGLLLGGCAVKRLFGSGETNMRGELGHALRFFARIIVPLLLIAALIESFITSALVKM